VKRPRIVVLERIDASGLRRLSTFSDVERAWGLGSADQLVRASKADAIVVKGSVRVDRTFMVACRRLRVVGRAGTGLDNIDVEAARRLAIKVLSVPTGNSQSAAEFAVLSMLRLLRCTDRAQAMAKSGDFRRHRLEGRELAQATVGLVGFGNVGRRVATILRGFGSKVLAYDPALPDPQLFVAFGVERATSLEGLLRRADVVSLHATLNSSSVGLIGRTQFRMMRRGALLVNTARGPLVDARALIEALDNGRVAMAALDVIEPEPPFDMPPDQHRFNHPLLDHEKIVVTPHMAASTRDAQKRIARNLADMIRSHFMELRPIAR